MLPESDIVRAARLVIENRGRGAYEAASIRSAQLYKYEPTAGEVWASIAATIKDMLHADGTVSEQS